MQGCETSPLPVLSGSEKQVAWATTIRQKVYDTLSAEIAAAPEKKRSGRINVSTGENVSFTADEFVDWLMAHTASHWWIDNRDRMSIFKSKVTLFNMTEIIRNFQKEYSAYLIAQSVPETEEETEIRKTAETEMIAAPEKRDHDGFASISVRDAEVCVRYDRDEDFRVVVKKLGYCWNKESNAWTKAIDITTGTAQERAAELGNNLLNAGFAVMIANPETRQMAIDGEYEPEHHRWVTVYIGGDYKGWFCVRLIMGDNMYEKARAIKGSQYCSPNVAVPPERWAELLDFADMYDYRITPAAQKLIDAEKAKVFVVNPAPVKAVVYNERNPMDVLNSSTNVLADLMEDD